MRNNIYLDEAPLEGGNGAADTAVEAAPEHVDGMTIEGQPLPKPEAAAEPVVEPVVAAPEAGGVATPTPTTPSSALSKEEIAEIARSVGGGIVDGLQRKQEPQTISEDEFNRRMNVFKVDEAFIAKFDAGTPQEKVALFNQLALGVSKQAITMARYLMEHNQNQLNERLNPIFAEHQRVLDERLEKDFFEANPDLKGYKAIAVKVKNELLSKGVRFKNAQEAFKEVAEQTRLVLKDIGVQKGSLPASKTSATPTSKMPVTSGTGHSGAKTASSGAVKNEVKNLWNK